MKNKIVFKSQKDFVKWVTVSNMFAKSRIMPMVALKQFNSLKANQRTNIKKAFEEYDQKRRIKIPKGEIDSAYIEKLSSYMASSGKQYSSHAATIRSWALRDHPAPVKRTYECKEDESL